MVAEKIWAWLHSISEAQLIEWYKELGRWEHTLRKKVMAMNLIEVFNTSDTNHDGVLDRTEFGNFLAK